MNCEFYNINDSYCIYRCFHFSQQNCHLSPNFKKASNWLSTYLPLQLEAEPVDLVMFMYVKLIVIIMKYIFVSTAFPTLNLQLRYNNMTSITATWYQQLQCNTSKTYPLVTCLLVFLKILPEWVNHLHNVRSLLNKHIYLGNVSLEFAQNCMKIF